MKNKLIAVLLLVTIWLPMVMWLVLSLKGVPDSHPIWSLVVVLVASGIFVIVPLATIRLLRAKDN